MQFKVTKTIITRATSRGPIAGILIILLILPILLLFLVIAIPIILFVAVRNIFRRKSKQANVDINRTNILLISNQHVTVSLIEDPADEERKAINDAWGVAVHRLAELYRASTDPQVPGLHDQFITSFIKETDTGAFLQIVERDKRYGGKVGSRLIFLHYATLAISPVADVGQYLLFDDRRNPWMVKGKNSNGEIEFSLGALSTFS